MFGNIFDGFDGVQRVGADLRSHPVDFGSLAFAFGGRVADNRGAFAVAEQSLAFSLQRTVGMMHLCLRHFDKFARRDGRQAHCIVVVRVHVQQRISPLSSLPLLLLGRRRGRRRAQFVLFGRTFRPFHQQKHWQLVEEDRAHPSRHEMRRRASKVDVDDDDSHQNGYDVHDESEKKVFGHERNGRRGGWENFGYKQKKHDQGEQDRDGERDLLARLRRQVEHHHAQERHQHGRDY